MGRRAFCRLPPGRRSADAVLGFAALSPVSARKVYAGVAEVSVYVSAQARGAGVGGALLRELVRASEAAGFWTLQAGIFPENHARLRLHEKCGFRVLGVVKESAVSPDAGATSSSWSAAALPPASEVESHHLLPVADSAQGGPR